MCYIYILKTKRNIKKYRIKGEKGRKKERKEGRKEERKKKKIVI